MKKFITILITAVLLSCLFSVTAYADMGSKPRVQITVKNPPQEKYYLDLLYYAGECTLHSNIEWTDDDMYTTLYNYNDNGWVPALARGTSAPMWGQFEPDENGRHILSYFGVPDEFKIIIVTESGEIKLSDIITRKSIELSLTLDYSNMSYATKPVWLAFAAQFTATCSITLVVEFVVLVLFAMVKKQNLKHFLRLNIITQLFLTALMSTAFVNGGTFSAYMVFPLAELIIFIFEMWYCKKYFVGKDDLTKLCYAAVANGVTISCTFLSLDKIMDFMFMAIR